MFLLPVYRIPRRHVIGEDPIYVEGPNYSAGIFGQDLAHMSGPLRQGAHSGSGEGV